MKKIIPILILIIFTKCSLNKEYVTEFIVKNSDEKIINTLKERFENYALLMEINNEIKIENDVLKVKFEKLINNKKIEFLINENHLKFRGKNSEIIMTNEILHDQQSVNKRNFQELSLSFKAPKILEKFLTQNKNNPTKFLIGEKIIQEPIINKIIKTGNLHLRIINNSYVDRAIIKSIIMKQYTQTPKIKFTTNYYHKGKLIEEKIIKKYDEFVNSRHILTRISENLRRQRNEYKMDKELYDIYLFLNQFNNIDSFNTLSNMNFKSHSDLIYFITNTNNILVGYNKMLKENPTNYIEREQEYNSSIVMLKNLINKLELK